MPTSQPDERTGGELPVTTGVPDADDVITTLAGEALLPNIPGYDVLDLVAQGGMGAVYRARQVRPDRLVALKVLLRGEYATPEDLARFRVEGEAIARLHDPGIVSVYEVGTYQSLPFMSLEFCSGGSLAQKLNGRPLPAREAAELLHVLARAMQAAHSANILHRDLKPANVLLASHSFPSGVSMLPKITDFGLARKLDEAGNTRTGAIIGTPSYMAPEQVAGLKGVGPPVDVYGLGAILYECLTGRPPFTGSEILDILAQVLHNEPVPVRQLNAAVPRDLETICLKCLHKEPHKRYASAEALAADLGRFLADQPVLARPSSRLERAGRWCRRNPSLAALSTSLFIILAGAAVAGPLIALHELALRREANEQKVLAIGAAEANEAQRVRAEANADEAARHEREAREALYAARQQFAANAWHQNRTEQMTDVLARQKPAPGKEDLRGFEWYYMDELSRSPGRRWRRSGPMINGVAIAPDGGTAISVGFDAQGVAWDVATGRRKWDTGKAFRSSINAVAISPDGETVALAGHFGQLQLWTSEGRMVAKLTGHQTQVFGVSFSPDGKTLASAGADASVRLWDVATGKQASLIGANLDPEREQGAPRSRAQTDPALSIGHTNMIWQAAWSPDGRRLATCSTDGSVKIWSVADKKLVRTLTGHEGGVVAVRWSPDGGQILSASRPMVGNTGGEGKLWSAATGKLEANFRHPTGGVHAIAFTPDNLFVVTAGMDRTVRRWRKDGRPAGEHRGFRSDVIALDVAGGGRWAVAGSRAGEVVAFDLDGEPCRCSIKTTDATRLALDRRGRLALFQRGTVTWHDPESLGLQETWKPAVPAPLDRVFADSSAFTLRDDGQSAHGGHGMNGPCPVIWRDSTGKVRHQLTGHDSPVTAVAFLPKDRLASADEEGHLCIWNGTDGTKMVALRPWAGAVRFLLVTAEGRLWAGGTSGSGKAASRDQVGQEGHLARIDGDRIVWEETTPRGVRTADLAPGGGELLVGFAGGEVSWRDALTGRELRRASLPVEAVRLRFSPDGKRIAAGTDDGIRLYTSRTAEEVMQVEGPKSLLSDILYFPDGKRLALMTALPLSGGELVILDARPAGPAKIPAPDLAWHKDKLALAAGRGEGFFDRPRRDLFAMRYHLRRLERLEPDERNWSLQQVALDQIAGNHRSAVARLEPIILRRPNDAPLWYDLGNGRRGKGDLAGAEVAYRRCIESNGQMPEAHCNLGLLLGHQGRFEEAIACLERGDALGQSRKKAGKGWAYPTGQWLARHRRLRDLASRFGDRNDFSGLAEADKTDVVETLLLIGRPLAACTLAQPKPNTSPGAVVIGAALRCADGRGDAKALNPAERARWRGRALAWLRQELADAHRSDPRGRADFVARMQGHPLLQLARPDRLDGWPEAERLPWQALWAEVDALKESP